MVVVVVCVLGVAASEGELAEEVVRLRRRVFVQFGACRCVWCDNAERRGDDALLLSACDSEVVGRLAASNSS
jgi:organic radical activating enzyme